MNDYDCLKKIFECCKNLNTKYLDPDNIINTQIGVIDQIEQCSNNSHNLYNNNEISECKSQSFSNSDSSNLIKKKNLDILK